MLHMMASPYHPQTNNLCLCFRVSMGVWNNPCGYLWNHRKGAGNQIYLTCCLPRCPGNPQAFYHLNSIWEAGERTLRLNLRNLVGQDCCSGGLCGELCIKVLGEYNTHAGQAQMMVWLQCQRADIQCGSESVYYTPFVAEQTMSSKGGSISNHKEWKLW